MQRCHSGSNSNTKYGIIRTFKRTDHLTCIVISTCTARVACNPPSAKWPSYVPESSSKARRIKPDAIQGIIKAFNPTGYLTYISIRTAGIVDNYPSQALESSSRARRIKPDAPQGTINAFNPTDHLTCTVIRTGTARIVDNLPSQALESKRELGGLNRMPYRALSRLLTPQIT